MKHLYKYLFAVFVLCLSTSTVFSQNIVSGVVKGTIKETAKKKIEKEAVKQSAKEVVKHGASKETERAIEKSLGGRIARRVVRRRVGHAVVKEGYKDVYTYTSSKTAKSLAQVGRTSLSNSSKGGRRRFLSYTNNIQKKTGKSVVKKEAQASATHLIKIYCGKDGFKKFMSLSMKDRMKNLKLLTKYVYSLPEIERNNILKSMNGLMKEKIKKCHKLMTTRMPPIKTPKGKNPKGHWSGERGNSYFILNDDYVWHGQSVKELKKKYKIKGELKIRYIDGEPIFDKNSCLGKTSVEYKPEYNYKDITELHNSVNEKLTKKPEPWMKGKMNKKANNPVRDLIENTAVDGSRVSGARNTYHEAMDGETIYIVPDFIHDICTHNGGRSLATLVQK
jgi:hypothetical protein